MTVQRTHPPTRAMRETPDIDQLKRQSRELLEAYRTQSPDAVIEVAAHHRTSMLEAGADTRGGIWPNRDATSPRTIAEERGYDEIVAMMVAQEEKRGARGANASGDGFRRLRHAMMTGGEEAVIAVLESQPALADLCPPDGVTMLHRAAGQGRLLVAKWLLDHGADVNRKSHSDFWRREGRTPLDFAAWECAEEPSGRSACEAMAALLIERGAVLTPLS